VKITAEDCRSCGACCTSESDEVVVYGFADLTSADVARMSSRVRAKLLEVPIGDKTHYSTNAKELPTGEYACQHLRGTPGQRCSCSIYETRPEVCRKFAVGSNRCRQSRRALNLRKSA
jgi:Fe-S-cluster containining protein